MSGEIENNTRFYSLREPAWHDLGYVSDEPLTIDAALKAADMDFTWDLHPVHTSVMDMNGVSTLDLPEKFAVVRTNKRDGERTAYGPVGKQYKPHSAQEIFSFIDELQGGGATVETIGSLGRGEREFVVVKLPDSVSVGGGDQTDLYLTGTTAFDGTQSTQFDLTPVRIVCANTWRVAKKQATARTKVRHTSELSVSDVDKARRVLDLSTEYASELESVAKQLLGTSMRDEDTAKVISELFPFPEGIRGGQFDYESLSTGEKRSVSRVQDERAKVFSLYKQADTNKMHDGNAWGLFNAVTEYADHYAAVRGEDKAIARAEKILLGKNDDLKSQALDLLLV